MGTLLGLAALPWHVEAATRELKVITAPDPAAQRPLLQALRQRYPGMQADADPAILDVRRHALCLALGPQALRRALEADAHPPLMAALTSSQAYRRQLAAANRDAAGVTALFAEASPSAQMQLIAALFERRVVVGALLSDGSAHLEKPLRQAAQVAGLDIQLSQATSGQDAVRAINALNAAQVLLAVPDGTLYTPDTLRAVLESTYRKGLPVIGFSAATVTAGTLACAHADLDDVAADLIDMIDGWPAGSAPLPEARYPRYWRVAINDNVARSLGLTVSDKVRNLGLRPPGRST
jgi:putative ABC transport system substrate-binding protein